MAVGWVEDSETHQGLAAVRPMVVSLRSTHPTCSAEAPLHQPLRIPHVNLPPRLLVDVETIDYRNGRRDRPERRVGGEDDVVRPEEVEAARNAVFAAEHGRVAVELPEVVEMGTLQRCQHGGIVLAAGAGAKHIEAGADTAIEIRNHAAAVVGDDL